MFTDKLYCEPKLSQPIVDSWVFPDTIVVHLDVSPDELIALWYCFDKLKAHRRPLALMNTISKSLSTKGYCLHDMT